LDDLVQRGQGTNFSFGAVSCRFTGFTHDRKYLKNHAKYHRIAIFTADDKNAKSYAKICLRLTLRRVAG